MCMVVDNVREAWDWYENALLVVAGLVVFGLLDLFQVPVGILPAFAYCKSTSYTQGRIPVRTPCTTGNTSQYPLPVTVEST